MKRVFLSVTIVFLFCVSLVPVSAWATSESSSVPAVPASSAFPDDDPVAGSPTAEPEPWSYPYPSITPEPFTEAPGSDAGAEEWSVYELTPVDTIWNKPFEDYTPTEGYLFLIFTVILMYCGFKIFRGGVL